MKKTITASILFSTMILSKPALAVETYKKETTISVTGNGLVSVAPERVKITSMVDIEGDSVKECSTKNKTIVTEILKKLEKNGISKQEVSVENYNVNFRTIMEKSKERKYYVSTRIVIDTEAIKKTSKILDILSENGITNIYDLNFYVNDKKKIEEKSYILAYQDAKTKAETIAKLEGARLVPKEIQMNNSYEGAVPLLGFARSTKITNNNDNIPLTIPKSIDIKTSVNAVFYFEK